MSGVHEVIIIWLSIADKGFYMMICTVYIFLGLAFTSTIIEIVRRQMVENLRRMQELRAQIQAQVKLAETLKKISDNAATQNIDIGANIADDLEQLKSNLNKFKKSNIGGSLLDVDIQQLDWVEDNKKIKAFIIYETSLWFLFDIAELARVIILLRVNKVK